MTCVPVLVSATPADEFSFKGDTAGVIVPNSYCRIVATRRATLSNLIIATPAFDYPLFGYRAIMTIAGADLSINACWRI